MLRFAPELGRPSSYSDGIEKKLGYLELGDAALALRSSDFRLGFEALLAADEQGARGALDGLYAKAKVELLDLDPDSEKAKELQKTIDYLERLMRGSYARTIFRSSMSA